MPQLQQFTNNASGVLASSISAGSTSITLSAGQGILFPAITGTQFFVATLKDTGTGLLEIVKVTARSGDTVTVIRGQEGTSASGFPTGSVFELRPTKQAFDNIYAMFLALTAQLATYGQARLIKSGSNIVLTPYNGNNIIIAGAPQSIPSAGVSLAPTGLTVGTLYYIYAYMNGTTMTLEASTTGHSQDTSTGVEIKTGDSTRSLVGMVRPITGPAFADTATQRFVRSWFNDPGVGLNGILSTDTSYASAAYAEIATSLRVEFLNWVNEVVNAFISGSVYNNGATNSSYTGLGFDVTNNPEAGLNLAQSAAASAACPVSTGVTKIGLAEGYHYVTGIGKPTAGTTTWLGAPRAEGCQINVYIKK